MAATIDQSGIFYLHHTGEVKLKEFPRDLRRGLLQRFDLEYWRIFLPVAFVICVTMAVLSQIRFRDTVSQKDIEKIQERFAQLVMNQPKPPVEEKKEEGAGQEDAKKVKDGAKDAKKVDLKNETEAARKQRGAAGSARRAAARERVSKAVSRSGIFLELTAAGTGGRSGGRSAVSDLIGAGLGDIAGISIGQGGLISGGAVDAGTVRDGPRGTRTTGVTMGRADVGRASGTQFASSGKVNITTSAPAEVSGDAADVAERSQSSIKAVVDRYTSQLKRIYEDALKRDPQLAGQLKVKFTILPSGEVVNVSAVKSTTNDSDFDDRIIRCMQRWRFPAIEGGGAVEVIYPFAFEGMS